MTAVQKQLYVAIAVIACLLSWIVYSTLANKEVESARFSQEDVKAAPDTVTQTIRWEKNGVKDGARVLEEVTDGPKKEVQETTVYQWTDENGEIQFSDVKPKLVKSVKVTSYRNDQNVLPSTTKKKEEEKGKKRIIGHDGDELQTVRKQVEEVEKSLPLPDLEKQIPKLMEDTKKLQESIEKRNEAFKQQFGVD